MVKLGLKSPTAASSGPLEADNACKICSVSLSRLAVFDVLRQLVESLITEFDGAKSDSCVALRRRWMQLPQSDDCLAVALLIERDGGAEYARIVILVGAMIELDQRGLSMRRIASDLDIACRREQSYRTANLRQREYRLTSSRP